MNKRHVHYVSHGVFALLAVLVLAGLLPHEVLTLGLPWLRVSVDHGTAFDIAGKGVADAGPMEYAIRWAARHAR